LMLGYEADQAKPGDWMPDVDLLAATFPMLQPYVAGSNFQVGRIPATSVQMGASTAWQNMGFARMASSGTLRLSFQFTQYSGWQGYTTQVRNNGIAVGSWSYSQAGWNSITMDLTVDFGDTISLHMYAHTGGPTPSSKGFSIQNATFYAADPAPLIFVS